MQVDESKIKWRQFVSGDNESYSWIYTTYVQILYRYGLRFTSDPEIIKDCIQEVFTSLYKNRNSLITPDNIKVYLFVSVKNCLIRTLYKESFYDRELPENIQFSLESTVEEDFINNEQYANQQKMIKTITVSMIFVISWPEPSKRCYETHTIAVRIMKEATLRRKKGSVPM